MTIKEAISHAKEVAERNRNQYKNCPADRRDIEHQTCETCAEQHELLADWLEELRQYRLIGTVEEFRLAKERLTPKKAIIGKVFKTMGYYQCPVCGGLLMRDEKFCNDCGQRIGW